ncbi:MAG: YceD family protein [Persicimonas sp.]
MSGFEIDLRDLEGGALEKTFHPTEEQLEELFSVVDDEFRLVDHDEFEADVRAQMTDATVHVAGHIVGEFAYDCGRCLEERELHVDTDVDFVLMSKADWSNAYAGEEEIALAEEDLDVSYYEGDIIDLGSLIREAVLLEFPAFPQCPDRLSEECDRLYEERVGEETLEELEDQKVDLRWSPLKDLKVTESGEVKERDEANE